MKRVCFGFLSLILLFSVLSLSVPADDYRSDASVWDDVTLRALYVQDDMRLFSDINPSFTADWQLFPIAEVGGVHATSTVNMRGFAMSHDGKYSYMGVQHGGGDIVRGMFVMETMTGTICDYYYRYDGDACDTTVPFSYPKGIDTDTRGYVYIGFTLSASYNAAYVSIARQNENGTLAKVVELPVCQLGAPGSPNGTKVGINGVDVVERDGRVLCYVVTNYEHDALYCFDVTNPQNPTAYTSFGNNGVLNLTSADALANGFSLDEGLYLDIDTDGTVYLCANGTDGKDGILVLEPDGRAVCTFYALSDVYCTEIVGNFLLCGQRTAGSVTVLDRQTGKRVASLSVKDSYGERVTRIRIVRDVLFVCDAGSVADSSNAVYAAALSDAGRSYLDAIVLAQNHGYADYETTIPDTDTPPESEPESEPHTETAPGTSVDRDTNGVTDTAASPDEATTPLETRDHIESPSDTPSVSDAGGCRSAVCSAWLWVLLAVAVVFPKNRTNH